MDIRAIVLGGVNPSWQKGFHTSMNEKSILLKILYNCVEEKGERSKRLEFNLENFVPVNTSGARFEWSTNFIEGEYFQATCSDVMGYSKKYTLSKYGEEIITKGDANNSEDKPIKEEQILGKVVKIIPKVGIWKDILLSPEILILIVILIILIGFLISRKTTTEENQNN